MNLRDLEDELVREFPHLKRKTIYTALSVIFGEMKKGLKDGLKVNLYGFGRFERKSRETPKSPWVLEGDQEYIHYSVKFYPSKVLAGKVKDGTTADR